MRLDLAKLDPDKHLFLGNGAAEYYVCGPEAFMVDVRRTLVEWGVAKERVFLELFATGDVADDALTQGPSPVALEEIGVLGMFLELHFNIACLRCRGIAVVLHVKFPSMAPVRTVVCVQERSILPKHPIHISSHTNDPTRVG
ncbi:hypothetical protein VTK26DRAFT_123 [Humicola hyalothermophila]